MNGGAGWLGQKMGGRDKVRCADEAKGGGEMVHEMMLFSSSLYYGSCAQARWLLALAEVPGSARAQDLGMGTPIKPRRTKGNDDAFTFTMECKVPTSKT